jgi:hypothetical protein
MSSTCHPSSEPAKMLSEGGPTKKKLLAADADEILRETESADVSDTATPRDTAGAQKTDIARRGERIHIRNCKTLRDIASALKTNTARLRADTSDTATLRGTASALKTNTSKQRERRQIRYCETLRDTAGRSEDRYCETPRAHTCQILRDFERHFQRPVDRYCETLSASETDTARHCVWRNLQPHPLCGGGWGPWSPGPNQPRWGLPSPLGARPPPRADWSGTNAVASSDKKHRDHAKASCCTPQTRRKRRNKKSSQLLAAKTRFLKNQS